MKRFFILLLMLGLMAGCSDDTATASLSAERIQELRNRYPIADGTDPKITIRDIPFAEIVDHADSVVIATIVEPSSEESFSSATFVSYSAEVSQTVRGTEVAEEIDLIMSTELQPVELQPEPGMKILTAIKKGVGEEQQSGYSFSKYGTFYIVDDDYVLSAFEATQEEIRAFNEATNGKPLQLLIEKIKDM